LHPHGVSDLTARSVHGSRLNRGGDRNANSALWTIANNRLIHDPRTRAYAARRTATGSSRKEILRLLKRYIARQVFADIRRALTPPNANHENLT
jgi:transposase